MWTSGLQGLLPSCMALHWWQWQAPPLREGLPPPSGRHETLSSCGVRHMPQEG